jgi:hypothetical protein
VLLYQQFVVVPDLRAQLSERPSTAAFTATLLRPSTRGAEQPLRLRGKQEELFVQLDLPPLPSEKTLVVCLLDRTNLARTPCFEAAVPEASEPLLVRVDTRDLPAGSYLFSVAPGPIQGAVAAPIARYPFLLVRR